MFNSLRTRLTLIFISLAIAPLIAVSAITSQRNFTAQEQQALDLQNEVAARVAARIDEAVREHEKELTILNEVRGLRNLSVEEQRLLLADLLAYDKAYQELALVDEYGNQLIQLSRIELVNDPELVGYAGSEAFQTALNGELYYSPVYIDEVSREPLLKLAVPVVDLRTAKVSAVLMAEFRFKEVWDLLGEMQAPGKSEVYVIDVDGRVIAHSNPSVVFAGTTFDLPSENGRATGLGGEDVILAKVPLYFGNQTFMVVSEQPTSQALEEAVNGLRIAAVITIAALVFAVIAVALTTRRIVRPIEQLSKIAKSIRDGDLSMRAPITSRDEIGEMAQSFNSMTEQLSDLISNLEERVAARTRDLRIAADVSRQITTVLDLDTLLAHLTEQTRHAFGLYHVSVFIYDAPSGVLKLEAATGEAGQQMKEAGKLFHLTDQQGLVPKAANIRVPVVANDTRNSPDHLLNPALPHTRSEIALPMLIGTKLVGVLDLQAQEANRFQEEDIEIFRSLADQIAIALRNAELFTAANRAREEAEQANKVKSQFLAAMSHELRTPLNGIINFTGFVADQMLGPVNEKQVKFLQDAIANAEHLLALINDVLDISKIEAGALKLFIEDQIDVAQEMRAVARTGDALLKDKPVKFILNIQDALPLVRGDKRRIRQIIYNLVSNACKFTEAGTITLTACQQSEELLLSVQDTGPGIAAEEHELIFQTFLQTEAGLRKGSGTGLGLPISRKLAEAHGGRLWLESQPGNGATFFVTLPIQVEVVEAGA
jgi:signal transduction histidine kinase